MRYLALASDYDGTLACDGRVDEETIRAVERLIHSGRRFILVTGRELPDLQSVFPRLDLCERVVGENGALLYNPATREKRTLAVRPSEQFLKDLQGRGVNDLSMGEVIIATWRPFERQAIEAIRDSGLELQIIFNKDAVMILPSGVNKMTGLSCALEELRLSQHDVVGIGDAENDHAFLESCEFSVAVANAIPALKEKATLVTKGARGAGVREVIEKLLADDLSEFNAKLSHGGILVGATEDGDLMLPRYGSNVLVCGQSGSGKSTLVTGLLERIMEKKYQICLIDPEGDYENLPGCRTVGDETHAPAISHVMQVLEDPKTQVIVNLVGVAAADRPDCFVSLITEVQKHRLRTGRPHWLVIDEAHHVLPREWASVSSVVTEELSNLMLITVHPEHVSQVALKKMNTVIIVGRQPRALLEEFAGAADIPAPDVSENDLPRDHALLWFCRENRVLPDVKIEPSRSEHSRHKRKYAEGQLEPERMFHFRGPAGKMNLPVQNLSIFIQLAEGIDAETWLFHLKRGDYSNWFRQALKDAELADQIKTIESDTALADHESRRRIKDAILQKYTAPA
jgi:hypothetical protein